MNGNIGGCYFCSVVVFRRQSKAGDGVNSHFLYAFCILRRNWNGARGGEELLPPHIFALTDLWQRTARNYDAPGAVARGINCPHAIVAEGVDGQPRVRKRGRCEVVRNSGPPTSAVVTSLDLEGYWPGSAIGSVSPGDIEGGSASRGSRSGDR